MPSLCTSARPAECPLVSEAHTGLPPSVSTRLPSSCKVRVYAPLFEVRLCPESSFWPWVSVSATVLRLSVGGFDTAAGW
ncbi:Uncharacterised protein [Mycobacteroides abscessus subsp. abscessus]|nr:Uncharacterised protein [Mycobacteroides abscessus subsp. abscessus]